MIVSIKQEEANCWAKRKVWFPSWQEEREMEGGFRLREGNGVGKMSDTEAWGTDSL